MSVKRREKIAEKNIFLNVHRKILFRKFLLDISEEVADFWTVLWKCDYLNMNLWKIDGEYSSNIKV